MGQSRGRDQGSGQERRRHPDLRAVPHHRGALPEVEVRPGAHPAEVKGKTLEQIKLEDEVYLSIKKKNLFAKVKEIIASLEQAPPEKGAGLRTFNVFVDGAYYAVEVECTSGARC